MTVERRMLEEITPRSPRNRQLVRLYDLVDEDDNLLNWSCSLVSQKIVNGKVEDEWFVNIHPKEIDETIEMLLKAKEKGVARVVRDRNENVRTKMKEIGDADADGGSADQSG